MDILKKQIQIPKIVYVLTIDEKDREVLLDALSFWLNDGNIIEQHSEDDEMIIGTAIFDEIIKSIQLKCHSSQRGLG